MRWREIERYEVVIKKITTKYTQDFDLRSDCAQNCRIELFKTNINNINKVRRDAYIRQIIRNTTLATLRSFTTGDWFVARKGQELPRYERLNQLPEQVVQITTDKEIVGRQELLGKPAIHGFLREIEDEWNYSA